MKLVDVLEVLKNDKFEKIERHESFAPSVVYDVVTNNEGKIRLAYHSYLFKKRWRISYIIICTRRR